MLFVCLGNICRSPTAHGVFARKVEEAGLGGVVRIDSAGTGAYHTGDPPDRRATHAAASRGYDLSALMALSGPGLGVTVDERVLEGITYRREQHAL